MTGSVPRRARRHPSIRLAGVLATSLAFAACSGGGPSTSTAPTSGAGASPAPAASTPVTSQPAASRPSAEASAEASPSEAAATTGPTPFNAPEDIGAVIPGEIAGHPIKVEVYSSPETTFDYMWADAKDGRELLESLGKTKDDISAAMGNADDIEYPETLFVYAYRVAGADGQAFRDGMVDRYLAILDGWAVETKTVGSKTVAYIGPKGSVASAGQTFYAVGDIVFNVTSNHPEWIEAAIALLP